MTICGLSTSQYLELFVINILVGTTIGREFERRSTHARYPTHEDMMADQENGIIIDEI
eukprot:SAG11_NODE_566_length_8482_cov_13.445477_2_plen_58_part_00